MIFIDPDLKQILSLFPPRALLVVNKADVVRSGFLLLKQMKDRASYMGDVEKLKSTLELPAVDVTTRPRSPDAGEVLPRKLSRVEGELILQVYFRQIVACDTLHLDLRARHFSKLQDGRLLWEPSALRTSWDSSFRQGVLSLYEGFYYSRPEVFEQGLERLGLFGSHQDVATRRKVASVFSEHFGEGRSRPIRFEVAHLRSSFESIFEMLLSYGIPIDSRFAMLGAALCTLYTTLEKIEEPLDVRRSYLAAIGGSKSTCGE